jgi:hypothetical protein
LTVVLLVGLIIAGLIRYGVSAKELQRIGQNILARPGGPMAFRFILQPAMAAIAALLDADSHLPWSAAGHVRSAMWPHLTATTSPKRNSLPSRHVPWSSTMQIPPKAT